MKRVTTCVLLISVFILLLSGCDPYSHRYPYNYPHTRWVSENPDIYFEMGQNKLTSSVSGNVHADVTYAQIIIDGEITELLVTFGGGSARFYDASAYTSTGELRHGLTSRDARLFSGLCRFRSDRMIVHDIRNDKGFLDDLITKIVFIREDIEPTE